MNFDVTPIVKSNLSINNNEIYIKREDLLPFSFGGNKVRIAEIFINDMYNKNKNYIVGYGSNKSNLSRAISAECALKKIPCTIISSENSNEETYNSYIVKKMGADIVKCNNNVHDTVENTLKKISDKGFNPYYIYGNSYGNGNEAVPVSAYVPVYDEILQQEKNLNVKFDYIFLACGTGMTYSGLLCGKKINNDNKNVVGISIARNKEIEVPKLKKMISLYCMENNIDMSEEWLQDNILFTDKYIGNGYSIYNRQIEEIIDYEMKNDGIAFDTTYTGKALWGMTEYIKDLGLYNKKVLFIHTGGTTLYFDYLNNMMNKKKVNLYKCTDKDSIVEFLQKIDKRLPVSLTSRVNLNQYADKVIKNGNVWTILNEDKEIISAVLFYSNDNLNKNAYLTLIGTLENYEGKGYGKILMNKMHEEVIKSGMKRVHLDTDSVNSSAISLYKNIGYVITSEYPKFHMVKEF